MKRWNFTLGIALAMFASLVANTPADEVDQEAIRRLGNTVQYVGDGGIRDDGTDAFVKAMAPPASDADKWFITVLTMPGCSGCEQLKRDWAKSEALLALADPSDPKKSWAHYNVYDATDESQRFRFENIKVRVYPTILVQPPRTGRYGDPATIVFQGVYGGKPDELARKMVDAMRRYVAKVAPNEATKGTGQHAQPAVGIDPPWTPSPRVTPQPNQFPVVDPTIPPPAPNTTPSLATILALLMGGGLSLSVVIGLVIIGLQLYRNYRKATNQPVVLNDEQFAALVATLQALAQAKSVSTSARSLSGKAK